MHILFNELCMGRFPQNMWFSPISSMQNESVEKTHQAFGNVVFDKVKISL